MQTPQRPLSVAIVDDEQAVRVGLGRLCAAFGYAVTAYESGRAFLDAVRVYGVPDCVILDMHMPGMTGLDVQDELNIMTDDAVVIAITADDSPDTKTRWLAGGALSCLRKPIGADELLLVLGCVGHRSARTVPTS